MANFFDGYESEYAPKPSEGTARRSNFFDGYESEFARPSQVDVETDDEIGRLRTGLSNVARSGIEMVTGVPKAIAIQSVQGAQKTLERFDRIDQGDTIDIAEREPFGFEFYTSRYKKGTPEERRTLRDKVAKSLDARKSSLYEAGESVDKYIAEALPVNPEYDKEFWAGDFSKGMGSMAGFMGVGLVTRRAGIPATPSVAIAGAALGSVEGFEDALNSGATLKEAYDSANLNGVVGVSEAIPIGNMLKRLDKVTGGVVSTALKNAIKQGTEEAIQETFQSIMGNVIANNDEFVGYDEERGTFTGADKGAKVGFTTGAVMGFVTSLVFGRRAKSRTETENDMLQDDDIASPIQNEDLQRGYEAVEDFLSPEGDSDISRETIIIPPESGQRPVLIEGSTDHLVDPLALPAPTRGETLEVTPEPDQRQPLISGPEEALALPAPSREPTGRRTAGDGFTMAEEGPSEALQIEYMTDGDVFGEGFVTPSPKKTPPRKIKRAKGRPIRAVKPEKPIEQVQELPAPKNEIDVAAQDVNLAPTDAQIEAGNYKKAHVNVQGLDITVENPKGSTRSGVDPDGNAWTVKMDAHYGYIKRTEGADGEQVDVYVGENPESEQVFIVDQVDPKTGKFDEHKVIMGVSGEKNARTLYAKHFSDGTGESRLGDITTLSVPEFKEWLKQDTTRPAVDALETLATDIKGVDEGKAFSAAAKRETELDSLKPGERVEGDGIKGTFVERVGGIVRVDTGEDITSIKEGKVRRSPDVDLITTTKALKTSTVDPLSSPGEWRQATITAETDGGKTIDLNAGKAMDILTRREKAANKLMRCINAG